MLSDEEYNRDIYMSNMLNVKRQPMIINGIEYTSSYDAAIKLNPDVTDKKELRRLRSLYRNRCVSSTYPDYVLV